jgi:hypothetical protein
LTEVQV